MIASMADQLILAGAMGVAFVTMCAFLGWLVSYFRRKDSPKNDES